MQRRLRHVLRTESGRGRIRSRAFLGACGFGVGYVVFGPGVALDRLGSGLLLAAAVHAAFLALGDVASTLRSRRDGHREAGRRLRQFIRPRRHLDVAVVDDPNSDADGVVLWCLRRGIRGVARLSRRDLALPTGPGGHGHAVVEFFLLDRHGAVVRWLEGVTLDRDDLGGVSLFAAGPSRPPTDDVVRMMRATGLAAPTDEQLAELVAQLGRADSGEPSRSV